MEKFMSWYKKTSLYFWLALVIVPSFRATFFASETRGRIVDIIIAIIVATISVRFFNLQVDIGANFLTLLLVFGTTIFFRILSNFFYLPAKLYFDAIKKQDRFTWEHITVEKKELKTHKDFRGYAVQVKNEKPFNFELQILIPYFEIDGIANQESEHPIAPHRRRMLGWVEVPYSNIPWNGWIEKDNGIASFYLLHKNPTSNENYLIQYYEFSEAENKLVERTMPVKEYVVGLLIVVITEGDDRRTGHEYNFEIRLDGTKKPTMKISNGGLLAYKPPKPQVINHP